MLKELNDNGIYFVTQFETFEIEIDFNKPELAQERLIEITEQVEKECPVGKFFDVSGVGEGVVWDKIGATTSEFRFKVKGDAHAGGTQKLVGIDVNEGDEQKIINFLRNNISKKFTFSFSKDP